jgi:group II intron reverse transcriptase/maturase
MRNADTILGVIRERGRRRLPLENIYRQLYNRNLYRHAYGRLYRNDGAMTPGATTETVDAMALTKIDAIIDALRYERYRWTPVRRVYIEKPHSTKKRPLGLPTWSDKVLQEVSRLLLEAYYDPQFSPHSHGFRPGRGWHTALGEITSGWKGVKWFIEGDISQGFDSLDHSVLLTILRESFHAHRCLRLIADLLKAGYLAEWRYHTTLSGVPQGGVVSPIRSNLYLDRLDRFVETVLLPASNDGQRRRPYPPYMALLKGARNYRLAGTPRAAKALRRQAQRLPSRDPSDPHFRRLWYVRYADDWLLGCSGPREEAETIKGQLKEYLRATLHLTLSHAKTLITNARTEAARFLGYEIVNQHADDKQHRALRRRCINGAPGLKVPVDVIRAKCTQYMRRGKPIHLAARLHDSDYSIVAQYQAAYRGVVQDYLRAYNVHRLWRVHWVMQRSLVKPLANQHRMRGNRVYRKYRSTVPTLHGTLTVLEVQHARGQGKKPLGARFGGIELRWQKQVLLNDQPKAVFGTRSEVVQRLLAQVCELCGAMAKGEVHHIRKLADLSRPGRRAKPLWVRRMAARRRKTLVVCQPCHEDIHRARPSRPKVTA